MTAAPAEVRPLTPEDRAWADRLLVEAWGATQVVSRGALHDLTQHPGLVAQREGAPVGLLVYRIELAECEVMSLTSGPAGQGIGTALIEAVVGVARAAGCRRLWLITTNDNLPALRFYQKRGFRLAVLRVGALEAARRLKPAIPLLGVDGIPLRDEIELDMELVS